MKHSALAILICAGILLISMCEAETLHRWDFNKIDDTQGWEVRPGSRGVVIGGALWLTFGLNPRHSARLYEFVGQSPFEIEERNLISSPGDLNISVKDGTQVRLRVLNLSPVTDFYLVWRAKGQDWEIAANDARDDIEAFSKAPAQSQHCALRPDLKQWQDVTCYVNKNWTGVIDQIAIRPAPAQQIRGDLWVHHIEILEGPPPPTRVRPDVASSSVIPQIMIPEISQLGFANAFKVLDECLVIDVPTEGFTHPFMAPGGYYGDHWYELDTSITLNGSKWANQLFAEDVIRGFRDVQALNPDGRIPGFGVLASGQVADISQTPRFFEVAYDVARRTSDVALRADIYDTAHKFLDWWTSPLKRDANTGLIVGLGDDVDTLSAVPGWSYPPGVLPIDLNMAVAIGADRISKLAADLGKSEEAARYRKLFQDLARAINAFLWDEKDGVYYNYILGDTGLMTGLHSGKPDHRVIAATFEPLRNGIASPAQRERLIKRLIDPSEFNWGKVPLTTLAMTDPGYTETQGRYNLSAWQGDVWIYRNMEVIKGLEEAGRPDLAAELNWATIKEFHQNYWEFLTPSTGRGNGVDGYGWTASQYIEAIVEHLFGIDFDAIEKSVRVSPHVPKALYGQNIMLGDLILPTGTDTRLSVRISQSSPAAATIHIEIRGPLPKGDLRVVLPSSRKEIRVPLRHSFTATFR